MGSPPLNSDQTAIDAYVDALPEARRVKVGAAVAAIRAAAQISARRAA